MKYGLFHKQVTVIIPDPSPDPGTSPEPDTGAVLFRVTATNNMTGKVEGNFSTMTTGDYIQDGTNVWTNGKMYLIFDPENREIYFTDDKNNPVKRCTLNDSIRPIEQLVDSGCYFSVNDAMLTEICTDGIWDFAINFEILPSVEVGQAVVEGETNVGNTMFTGTVHKSVCCGADGNNMYYIKDKYDGTEVLITYVNGVWALLTPATTSDILYQNESGTVFGEYTPVMYYCSGKVIITPLS
jgi:hypothetical protein